jgi:hypothetical protein
MEASLLANGAAGLPRSAGLDAGAIEEYVAV